MKPLVATLVISLLALADDVSKLCVRLTDSNKWVRKDAVEKLAALGRDEVWEHVVDALDDPKGEVADTAQLVVAAVDTPEGLERLLGTDGLRARDEWTRIRAGEAVGRVGQPVDAHDLARALGDRSSEVRRAVCWSIERLGAGGGLREGERAGLGAKLERIARRDREPCVRARAAFALAAIDAHRARDVVHGLARDKEPLVRSAAAALAPELFPVADALALLESLAGDAHRCVRASSVEGLARLARGEPPHALTALRALVARLEAEAEKRDRERLVELLRALSGRKHRADPRPWRAWVDTLDASWRFSIGAPPDDDAGATVAGTFGGMPIRSERLSFLIDLSGSMWTVREDGKTRKQVVEGMLREALEGLPETTRFNVIPFTGEPIPWSDELEPATRRNIRAATRFFDECDERGTGNFWDAAALALADADVDTLVVLTDGEPTGGRRHRLELLVPLFLERYGLRRVAIDSILVDASRATRAHWQRLGEATLGSSIELDL